MSINLTIRVTRDSDNTPIVGAKIFVDGQNHSDVNTTPIVTPSSGQVSIVLNAAGNRIIEVSASSFVSESQPITVSLDSAITAMPMAFSLASLTAQISTISLAFIPPQQGFTWTLKQGASTRETGVSSNAGIANPTSVLTYGNYTLIAIGPGYTQSPSSGTIVVDGRSTPYSIVMVANADANTTQTTINTPSTLTATEAADLNTPVSVQFPDSEEFIYPNTDYDKYFTSTSARIYIGNLFIDEVNMIQFALQDNAVPIYGYASRFADAYGQGRSLVQGQLVLNFVTEGYLYTVLQAYKQYMAQTASQNVPANNTVAQILGLYASRDALLQLDAHNPNFAAPASTVGVVDNSPQSTTQPEQITISTYQNAQTRAAAIDSSIQSLLSGLTPAQMQQLSQARHSQLSGSNDIVGYNNAVYHDTLFTIRVELGNEATGVVRVRQLEKVKLISNEQVYDQSGNVLLDSYGFIARRCR